MAVPILCSFQVLVRRGSRRESPSPTCISADVDDLFGMDDDNTVMSKSLASASLASYDHSVAEVSLHFGPSGSEVSFPATTTASEVSFPATTTASEPSVTLVFAGSEKGHASATDSTRSFGPFSSSLQFCTIRDNDKAIRRDMSAI